MIQIICTLCLRNDKRVVGTMLRIIHVFSWTNRWHVKVKGHRIRGIIRCITNLLPTGWWFLLFAHLKVLIITEQPNKNVKTYNNHEPGSSLLVTTNLSHVQLVLFIHISLNFSPSRSTAVFIISSRLRTKPKRENPKMARLHHRKILSFLTFPCIPYQTSERERWRDMRHARDSTQSDISKLACSNLPVDSSVSTPWRAHQSVWKKQRLTNHVNTLICHHPRRYLKF